MKNRPYNKYHDDEYILHEEFLNQLVAIAYEIFQSFDYKSSRDFRHI